MNQPASLGSLRQQSGEQQQPAPRNEFEVLKKQLERGKAEFLPLFGGSQQNVDEFIRVVLNAAMANPDLLTADRRTFISSCMRAAQDGLMPDGREAVLNVYSTKVVEGNVERWVPVVQYLPMVGGMIKQLYESGMVTSVDAAAVFANDRFLFRRGDDPKLEHEPTMSDDPGKMIASYCVVKLTNGDIKREVMPMRDILRVKAVSKAQGAGSPWVKWPDQQGIKSVIKRIYKQLPKSSPKFERAERSDNEALGFAGTPDSIAEIAARNTISPGVPTTIDMPTGTPALTDSTGEVHQFTIPTRQQEFVRADRGDPTEEHGMRESTPSGPAPGPDDDPPVFDVEAFEQRMQRCTSLDTLDVLADEIRSLADEGVRQRLQTNYMRLRRTLENSLRPEAPVARDLLGPTPAPAPAGRAPRTPSQRMSGKAE